MSVPTEPLLNDPEIRAAALRRLEQENIIGDIQVAQARRQEAINLASGDNTGRFVIAGAIMEGLVHTMISAAENWSLRHPGEDIEILLNSPGGSVTDGLALIDYVILLRKRGHHVKIVGTGMVASMAGALMQAADERVLTSRAYFGMHEVSGYIGRSSTTEAEDQQKFMKKLQADVESMLVSRSNFTLRTLRARWKRKDIWCDAKEALELGLIDRIEDTHVDYGG